ncbi:gephyrin-like molybdotransferase Glp [Neomegalonema sp.]|uniref:molybdopterin molybdotransferase MoeA n=1 Tax=Neomegalonema sp. TaxID=2039713 RepID=UPI0026116F8F|nr:gephyrin-like molybdotransferase Glp [Neomegalonema sp.]MDD2867952.1 molybdopterin molybdotransferase MoeA [Neomegalonema sp.]
MIPVSEALERLRALVPPLPPERLPLEAALGRFLAEEAAARLTQPPFDASSMDGYALRRVEAEPGARFRVVGESAAGRPWSGRLGPGEALRIFTGAPVPEGADQVVIQEEAAREGAEIRLLEGLDLSASNIRAAGRDFRAGEVLIPAGRRIGPRELALLASMNLPEVLVGRAPRVGILPMGDELVSPGATPGPGRIVASAQYGLLGLARQAGAEARLLPVAPDDLDALRAILRGAAAEFDLLVTIGGASVGDHDHLRPALAAEGAELALHRLALRPGKPLTAARLGGLAILGLPGNPVSAQVCGELFLRPALERLMGGEGGARTRRPARLAEALPANGPREHYMRATLESGPEGDLVRPFSDQDSSRARLLTEAQALLVRAARAPAAGAGEWVEILPLEAPWS